MVCQDACAKQTLPGLCQPAKVFVDVGAHIGSVIAEVRLRHPELEIIAIEADPEKAAGLARRFPNITVHSCAVGENGGKVPFYVDKERHGYSSLARRERTDADVHEISVEMRRLDDIVPPAANVDLIKIDVEGAELGVLRGASELVARCRPVIFFESGPDAGMASGYSIEGLFDWFAARSYDVVVPDRLPHDGPALTRDGFIESHFFPFRAINYFAVPTERRIEIRDVARRELGIVPEA